MIIWFHVSNNQNKSHSTMRYIAFLRGINVGGNNKISMPVLKEVITYINSGNIIFTSELDAQILHTLCQEIIFETFDLRISVGIIKGRDFIDIINNAPKWWNNGLDCKHNLIFVIPPATVEEILVSVGEAKPEYERVARYGNVIFWTAPLDTFLKTRWSKVSKNKEAYQAITIRNANTILKVAELVKNT